MANQSNSLKTSLDSLEHQLLPFFTKKLPMLPPDIRKILADLSPWFALIGTIFGALAILALLGLGTLFTPIMYMGGVKSGTAFFASNMWAIIFMVPMTILEGLAIQELFAHRKKGWNYLFYAALLGIIQNVVEMNILGAVLNGLISLYILFQTREYFT